MSYEQLLKYLMDCFSDTSRSAEQTATDLRALRDEIIDLLDTLP